jgi:hypothetical protein
MDGRPGQEMMMMGVIWFLLGMNVYELALPPGGKLKGFS